MKRLICLFVLLFLTVPSVCAVNKLPEEVEEVLPRQARELLGDIDFSDVSDLASGIGNIGRALCKRLEDTVYQCSKGAISVFLVIAVCGLIKGVYQGTGKTNDMPLTMAGSLSIAILMMGSVDSFIGMGAETIRTLREFSKILLPVLATATAGTGAVTTATFQQVTVVFLVDLLLSVIHELLLPLTYLYVGVLTAASCLSSGELSGIAEGLKKVIVWLLTTALVGFTLYLSVVRIIAGNVDGAAIRMTKTAISGVVPVVGGIIAEASETILAGAGILKNTVGIFGTLAILAICAYPFLQLGVQYLLYKLTAFFSQAVGQAELCKLVQGMGGAFGVVLGMTGSSALLLLISVLSCIAAVMPW